MKKIIKLLNDKMRPFVVRKSPNFQVEKREIAIISSNCNGAVLLHDLGLPFNSPFVNCWIPPKDFVRLVENIDEYLSKDLTFIKKNGISYPVGLLGDVCIYFEHYTSENQVVTDWKRRLERLNRIKKENIYVMFTDRDGCTLQDLQRFDRLPYKKVVFVSKPDLEINSAYYIPGFEDEESVGILTSYKPGKIGTRYFDCFNFSDWLRA